MRVTNGERALEGNRAKGNGKRRVGNEPKPTFMTDKVQGFTKFGNHYITRGHLEETKAKRKVVVTNEASGRKSKKASQESMAGSKHQRKSKRAMKGKQTKADAEHGSTMMATQESVNFNDLSS
ncbi:hypothetical protein JCGZ_22907 [Jatropha curcas]|uniref:Uncharacterized protein n=1 Tax=Jatropha curcas TaxID=180498 RepID=A0A067JPS0_JATCU|nr:hypothetical protein JCGZ_22907 [Jatropha curcas]